MKKTVILFVILSMLVLAAVGCDSAVASITDPAAIPAAQPQEEAFTAAAFATEPGAQPAEPVSAQTADQPAAEPATDIGEEEAKRIAFEKAGLTTEDIAALQYIVVRKDTENGKPVYEVDFVLGTAEYDFDIRRDTGDVVSWDRDIEDYAPDGGTPSTGADIGKEQAEAIALARVSGASGSNVHLHSDYDNGRLVYEGRVVYNGIEYEFEIDAETGEVRQWSSERYDPNDDDRYDDDDWDDDDDDWDDDRDDDEDDD